MRILVTGSSGFIGAHLVEALLARGHEVIGVDHRPLPEATRRALEAAPLDTVPRLRGRYEHHLVDIRRATLLGDLRADAMVHLAALTGVRASVESPLDYYSTNVEGSANMLVQAKRAGVRHVILASTSSTYGDGNGPFVEEQPTRPLSPYAASKVGMEAAAYEWHRREGVPVDVLRFFTVYGPRGRRDMLIGKAIDQLKAGEPIRVHGDGSALRDWTYVGETVRGIVAALDSKGDGYRVTNLGAGTPVSVNDALRALSLASGCTPRIERGPPAEGDVAVTWANTERAKERFGWQNEVSLEQGLTLTWEAER